MAVAAQFIRQVADDCFDSTHLGREPRRDERNPQSGCLPASIGWAVAAVDEGLFVCLGLNPDAPSPEIYRRNAPSARLPPPGGVTRTAPRRADDSLAKEGISMGA